MRRMAWLSKLWLTVAVTMNRSASARSLSCGSVLSCSRAACRLASMARLNDGDIQDMEVQRLGKPEEMEPVFLRVVSVAGEPWWEACGGGRCVRDRCGSRAQELLRLVLLSPSNPTPESDTSEATSSAGNS